MNRRVVISGTYATGKTTTATALSLATGIPMVNALSARELLTDLYPGRRFQDMDSVERMALGLKRFEERTRGEIICYKESGCFISDGSVLNEWIDGTVRMNVGSNLGSPIYHQIAKAALGIPGRSFFKKYLAAYGQVVNQHAKKWYTDVVHLPVEFDMEPADHRPASKKYRRRSDAELKKAYQNVGFQALEISGSSIERVDRLIRCFDFPQVLSSEEAVIQAKEKIKQKHASVSRRINAQYQEPSIKEKISFLTKF